MTTFKFPVKCIISRINSPSRRYWVKGHYIDVSECSVEEAQHVGKNKYMLMNCDTLVEELICAEYLDACYSLVEEENDAL